MRCKIILLKGEKSQKVVIDKLNPHLKSSSLGCVFLMASTHRTKKLFSLTSEEKQKGDCGLFIKQLPQRGPFPLCVAGE